jgi:hypothetical protein
MTGEQRDAPQLWVRVGGGVQELATGMRHGPADPDYPPLEGLWEGVWLDSRLVGWAPSGWGRGSVSRALAEGERIARERRAHLLRRLGHKLRSSVFALQECARQASHGRQELLEEIYDQAQDVGRLALVLETVALDPQDPPRGVVIGAVLNLAAARARRALPSVAVVRARETVLVEALSRTYEWMGGPGSTFTGELIGRWWRLEVLASPDRNPLAVPELGEPLVRHLVDVQLEGWLDAQSPERVVIYLPAM